MDNMLFNRQFIISKDELDVPTWNYFNYFNYHFYIHPSLNLSVSHNENRTVIIIGYLFDYREPELSNENICDNLAQVDDLMQELIYYSGLFIVFCEDEKGLRIIPDACAQRELYYKEDYSLFASQIKLMEHFQILEDVTDPEMLAYFDSAIYKKNQFAVSAKTRKKGVYRLMANHFIELISKRTIRCFPVERIEKQNLEIVVAAATSMFQGYLKAISLRYKIAIPLTAGLDSRVIFAASIRLDPCRYFIYKHLKLYDKHPDIVISSKIAQMFSKHFDVIDYSDRTIDALDMDIFENSIDIPRKSSAEVVIKGNKNYFADYIILNGNLGEIARSYYDYSDTVSGRELAALIGCKGLIFAEKELSSWYEQNKMLFKNAGLSLMDMLFWEIEWGPKCARGKGECHVFTEIASPFNSMCLLTTMLGVDKKYRDKHSCILFKEMIREMTGKEILYPVNPSFKHACIVFLKNIGIYRIYRKLVMKYF